MISWRISPQDCLSLSHYSTELPGAGHICAHIRGLPKASGGKCRFVEVLIVLLSHFCCNFSPLPTAFQDRDPVWIPQARKLQLSVGALITAHPPTKQLSLNNHSFKKWIPSNVFPALGHSSKWLCVCIRIYMCLHFTVILVKICNYSL